MTDTTIPAVAVSWEPIAEGIILQLDVPVAGSFSAQMPMMSVRELRDDMIEANFLSRGFEKVECLANEVQHMDKVIFGDFELTIINVLADRTHIILQTATDEYEVRLPFDEMVTVWRAIE